MKWFKHFTNASDDEFISWVEDNFGLEGYARWWKLLEVIAKQMDSSGKCSAKYSWQKWQTFLKGKRKQLGCFLVALENQRKIKLVDSGNELEIICNKLLELRDNHTKNLQVANKSLASKEVEEEVEEEVNNKLPPIIPQTQKRKITLDELSVDHIAEWLAKKRSQGRYLQHDENFVLEKFKDYCNSKGKKYADYTAAYRNAFDWEKCQPTRGGEGWRTKQLRGIKSAIDDDQAKGKRTAFEAITGSS